MITFFPQLYPGELLYSWFARYHNHSGNLSFKSTTNDLFGKPSHISTPDLPCCLNILNKNLHYFCPPSPEKWVRKHTFYNYYTAFSSKRIKDSVFNSMLDGDLQRSLHMLTGNMASSVHDIQFFRYCPTCVSENVSLYGEPYLQTVHQYPSSFVCPDHEEILCNTTIPFRSFNKHEFRTLKLSDCTGTRLVNGIDKRTLSILLTVAKESKKLIEENIYFDPELLQKQYKSLLRKKGLITPNGNVRQSDLSKFFLAFCGNKVLDLLQSTIKLDNESCWLKTITRKHRKTFHPIRHILLISFLGETLESLSSRNEVLESTILQFGKGPFPCLNKASSHYKREIIKDIKITTCSKTKLPIGTFTCDCGFIYTRRGPDPLLINKYHIGRVKQFGDIWLSKLKQLTNMNSYSYRELGKMLNVDTKTVIKYSNLETGSVNIKEIHTDLHQQYRTTWLKLRDDYSELSRTELRYKNPGVYTWLYRNDRDWLKTNSPKIKSSANFKQRIDWDCRDIEIAEEIIPAVIDMFSLNKPRRVTISAIGKQINKLSILEKHIDKLPKTKFILAEVIESTEEFQKRRIVWAAEQLNVRSESLDSWKIKKLAGLNTNVSNEIIHTIELVKLRIRKR